VRGCNPRGCNHSCERLQPQRLQPLVREAATPEAATTRARGCNPRGCNHSCERLPALCALCVLLCSRGLTPLVCERPAALRTHPVHPPSQAFDETGFLEGAPEAVRPFLKELRASQLLEVFIQAHVELSAEARATKAPRLAPNPSCRPQAVTTRTHPACNHPACNPVRPGAAAQRLRAPPRARLRRRSARRGGQ